MAKNDPGLLKRIVTTAGGIILILLGIVGLFLPVLQGILLIAAGLGLLSVSNERVREWIGKARTKYAQGEFRIKGPKMRIFSRKRPLRSYGSRGLEEGADNDR